MDEEFKKYRKRVFNSILYSFVIATLVYALIIFLTDVIFKDFIANSLYNMNYKIYYLIVTNKYIIFIIIFVLTIFISIFYSLNKTIKSMSVIINSIDKVFKKDESLIELPTEFKEVQNKLNSIKYDMMKNEQMAKEAEQRKNDLVVYLAHDLKTPLTSIIGYLNLLNEADDIKKVTFKKYISILIDKSNRLEALINEFFEITRFNMQNLNLTKSKINLKIMINQLVSEFYPMLTEKGLEFNVNISEDIYINVDADKLARVFDNILRNAINYSYEKSIIEINVTKDTELVQISFKNNGKTIPQNEIANIFEKFYRLDSARNSYTGGAGLGLAIAKEIVELHGGKISAISKDEITQFNVTLPL